MGSDAIKKRRRRSKKKSSQTEVPFYATIPTKDLEERSSDLPGDVQVEYVVQTDIEGLDNPEYSEYAEILEKFKIDPTDKASDEEEEQADTEEADAPIDAEDDEESTRPSKKQRKRDKRDKIEVLKLLSEHPEIVEIHDVNATYPWLLVHLKGYRNSVPVPRHWCQRRKYLQGKRGVEKIPFELPDFILATGIADMRQAVLEKEESQKLKSAARERLKPKTGKIDIDYHVLYDAFFRNQTKPRLTTHGDLYYEGKEFEVDLKERKPGHLSRKLREALGMPAEGVAPPPWLANMQRFGPPPAYPHLRIPGVNAPTPPGAKMGFQPGGWGQLPVDAAGRPLYGGGWDRERANHYAEPVEKTLWGILDDRDESDEEMEDDGDTDEPYQIEGVDHPHVASTAPSASSGTQSVSGYETPESLDLRKGKAPAPERDTQPKQLYQELRTENSSVGSELFGSQHRYVMPTDSRIQKAERMEVSLDPNELANVEGITEDMIRKKYDDTLQLEKDAHRKEDMSDLIASESAKRRRKDKKREFRF